MEGVDAELILPLHHVNELEFHGLCPVVSKSDEGPAIVLVDLHHLGHVGLLPVNVNVSSQVPASLVTASGGFM